MNWFSIKQMIPFFPLYQMIKVQLAYGFVKPNRWHLILIWVTKLFLLEPFRLIEAVVMCILPDKEVQPVFILGYYRSGTTYLQELLSANDSHATLTLFQSVLPEVSLCFSWLFKPLLSFFFWLFKVQNEFHSIPFDFDFPGEEDVAINSAMAFYDYNRIYQYPSNYQKVTDKMLIDPDDDIVRDWCLSHRYLVKKIAYVTGKKILILKSPPNMARVPILKSEYPSACFIFIHRNPIECVYSTKRIWKLNQSFSFEKYTDNKANEIIKKQYVLFYTMYRKSVSDASRSTVSFNDLIGSPEKSIKQIYADLGLINFEESRLSIQSVIRKRSKPRRKFDGLTLETTDALDQICVELGY